MTHPWLSPEAPSPLIRLTVQAGRLLFDGAESDRTVTRTEVELTPDSLKFDGQASRLTFAIEEWPELAMEGELTLHVRLRGSQPGIEQFIAGRYAQNYLTLPQGWAQANVRPRSETLIPVNSRGYCEPDQFYDIVLRFRAGADGEKHEVVTELYEVESGALVSRSHPLPRHFDCMYLTDREQPFTLGGAGDYAAFRGEISEVTVWDQMIPTVEVAPKQETAVVPIVTRIDPREELLDPMASRRWHEWLQARETFPIAAWGYFHRFRSEVEDYRVYRDANLTMVMAPLGSVAKAEEAGLDPVIGLWEDDGEYAELYQHPKRLAEYIEVATKQLTRCAGYMLADEPRFNGPGVDELAPGFRTIYNEDQRALPMVNMMCYPYQMGGGFEYYLEQFIRGSHPAFLVSDVYVLFRQGRGNDTLFYANVDVVRRKALEAGIGFMGFVLNTGHNRHWPENSLRTASESDLHWQVNTLLAYGAQGLWYYNYRIEGEGFDEAIVTGAEGKPTRLYEQVKQLNAGVLANGELLQRLVSVDVWHCRPAESVRGEYTRVYADGVIDAIEHLEAEGVVVGEFEEHETPDSSTYVMLVNQRHGEDLSVNEASLQTTISLQLASGWRAELIDANTGKIEPLEAEGASLKLTLGGGARALLRLIQADA